MGFPPPAAEPVGVAQAAVRGMQDLRAAVCFFRKDAATTNTCRVSPAYIAVGNAPLCGVHGTVDGTVPYL